MSGKRYTEEFKVAAVKQVAQLGPADRNRKTRQTRAIDGSTRLDFFLDPP